MSLGTMFWRASHKCFYAKLDGKFKRLSPDKEDAEKLYQVLLVEHGTKDPTVADGVCMYLEWLKKAKAPSTHAKKKRTLDTLVAVHGAMKASQLEPSHLKSWEDKSFPKAGPTTVHDRLTTVKSAWRWLSKQNRRVTNLIEDVEKPTPEMREFFLLPDQWPALLDACSKTVRPVIEFMLRSGARPQEACRITIDQWKGDHVAIRATLAKGKVKSRQIMVPTDVIPLVVKQIGTRKTGHIFLNSKGKPWNKSSFNCAFRRLKVKLNMPELCAYTMRHSFAAGMVASGVHMEHVAKLMGHKDTSMVYKRYGHLDKQHDLLRRAIDVVLIPSNAGTPTCAS
jgi:integrase